MTDPAATAPDLVVLESEELRLTLAPHLGAGLVNLEARVGDGWAPLLRFTSPETLAKGSPSGLASFTLAPYSNRIPGARFAFEGRLYTLRPTTPEGNAQHGDVRGRAHRLVSRSDTHAKFLFDSRDVPDFNFPFPVTLTTTYALDGARLTQTLDLVNVGASLMPAGLGLHPYFSRTFGGASDVSLTFSARGLYETDETMVPRREMVAVPPEFDFSTPREVGETALNTVYGGWDGRATLRYVGTPFGLDLHASDVFSHLVVYAAPDGSLAVEPVTHATDAFNLHERGVKGVGFRRLEPGERLSGTVDVVLSRRAE